MEDTTLTTATSSSSTSTARTTASAALLEIVGQGNVRSGDQDLGGREFRRLGIVSDDESGVLIRDGQGSDEWAARE